MAFERLENLQELTDIFARYAGVLSYAVACHLVNQRPWITPLREGHRIDNSHPALDAGRPTTQKSKETMPWAVFSKDIKTMDDLFVHTLQDIYYGIIEEAIRTSRAAAARSPC